MRLHNDRLACWRCLPCTGTASSAAEVYKSLCLREAGCQHQDQAVSASCPQTDMPLCPACCSFTLPAGAEHRVVRDYLMCHGYADTLQAFDRASGTEEQAQASTSGSRFVPHQLAAGHCLLIVLPGPSCLCTVSSSTGCGAAQARCTSAQLPARAVTSSKVAHSHALRIHMHAAAILPACSMLPAGLRCFCPGAGQKPVWWACLGFVRGALQLPGPGCGCEE